MVFVILLLPNIIYHLLLFNGLCLVKQSAMGVNQFFFILKFVGRSCFYHGHVELQVEEKLMGFWAIVASLLGDFQYFQPISIIFILDINFDNWWLFYLNARGIYQNLESRRIKFNLRFNPHQWQNVSAFHLKNRRLYVSCRNDVFT